jgi:hypothetical protein
MNINASASLLDKEIWQGRLFTGQWSDGDSVRDIVEPATGKQLGQVGMANAQTLGRCAAEALKASCVAQQISRKPTRTRLPNGSCGRAGLPAQRPVSRCQ